MDLLRNSVKKSLSNKSKSSLNKSKKNNSINLSLKSLNNSFKSPIVSSIKSSIKNFDIKNIYENNAQTILSVILFIIILISYISKKYYIHLGLLFVLSIIIYFITKNLFYALFHDLCKISIIGKSQKLSF